MTSTEIEKLIKGVDGTQRSSPLSEHPVITYTPTEKAKYRATLEVAWQLALLNEQIGGVLNSRMPQIAVRVESGEWPSQVKIQDR